MKKTFSIFLIFVMLSPLLHKFGIWVDFKWNQDFIASVLCINKEKPKMQCNGNCYLSKQLEASEEKENEQAPKTAEEELERNYFNTTRILTGSDLTGSAHDRIIIPFYNRLHSLLSIKGVFHPPDFL